MPEPRKRKKRSDAGTVRGQGFTLRQQLFVSHYVRNGGDAKNAAIEAGYTPSTAEKASSRILSTRHVQDAIKAELEKLRERIQVDQDWGVQQAIRIYETAMADVRPKRHSRTGRAIKDAEGNPVFQVNLGAATAALRLAMELVGAFAPREAKIDVHVGSDREIIELRAEVQRRREDERAIAREELLKELEKTRQIEARAVDAEFSEVKD